jgi:Asp-tRNA(Asn)/Glu-tRNA(Gln) amidotransferase C subunit
MSGMNLFGNVPEDFLEFGRGANFDPKKVPALLGLKKEDVSRLAEVSKKSVRYDENIPERVRDRLEEIGATVNMVAQAFDGDVEKTVAWFKARNPMLGDVAPRDMIRLGRYERLRRYIINAMTERSTERLT